MRIIINSNLNNSNMDKLERKLYFPGHAKRQTKVQRRLVKAWTRAEASEVRN